MSQYRDSVSGTPRPRPVQWPSSRQVWQRMRVTLFLAIVSGAPFSVGEIAAQDRYAECQLRAKQASGYDGPVPGNLVGGAIGGAARGAAIGAVIGGIFGGKDGAEEGAKKAAIGGGIRAALRRGAARSAADERRRFYQFELEQCMNQQPASDPSPPPPIVSPADDIPPDQDLSDEPFGLEALTCLNVISLDEEERTPLLLLTYGYSAGKGGDATHSAAKIGEALSSFGGACSQPDRLAWEAVTEAIPGAQVAPGEGFSLEEMSCWNVMTLYGDDRDLASLLLFGYAAGKAGDSVHSAARIGSVLERTNTYCEAQVEAPMANLIETALNR